MKCIIEFEDIKKTGYARVKGIIEADGFVQKFTNDKELHDAIDNLTERIVREEAIKARR